MVRGGRNWLVGKNGLQRVKLQEITRVTRGYEGLQGVIRG